MVSRALTVGHVVLVVALVGSFAGLVMFGGMVFDRVTPVAFWAWGVGAPVVGGAALVVSRRGDGGRGRVVLNGVLLAFWGLAAIGALLLH